MENVNITLTAAALTHARDYLIKLGNMAGMRFGVKKSGCSGYAYFLEPSPTVQANDYVIDFDGVKLIIDPKSLLFVNGTELDYTTEGLNSGFSFNNPNEKNSCGCGESFNIE